MAKVEIFGPKSDFFDVVSLLHDVGTLHIEDLGRRIGTGEVKLERMQAGGDRLEEIDRDEDLLIRVRAIIKALAHPDVSVDSDARQRLYLRLWAMGADELSGEVSTIVDEVEERTQTLASEKSALESEIVLLTRYEPVLAKIQPLAAQIVTTGNYESVALLVERRYKGGLEALKTELDKITHRQCEIVSTDVDDETTAVIVVFSKTYATQVHDFMSAENVNQIRLPSELQDVPFDKAYETIVERRALLPKELEEIRAELLEMSDKWYLKLTTIRDVLGDKLAEVDAIPKFGQTDYTFVITGWIPVDDLDDFKGRIQARFGDRIIVDQKEIKEEDFDETPVAMKNSGMVKPFQSLLFISGTPKYGTIDPTWMIFIFYPLFFGMIVGDVGYGAIMLAIVFWARLKYKHNDNVQMATAILGPAATMAIAFGFIYGEFFGNLGNTIAKAVTGNPDALFPLSLFPRTSMVTPLIVIVIVVGLVQVIFGLVLGMVNGVRTKHYKHVYEKGGMLAFLVGVFGLIGFFALAAMPFMAFFQQFPFAGYGVQALLAGLIFFGLAFAMKGGGIVGLVESVSSFANVFSYIRIMAVGLAGAMFADAINELFVKMGNPVVGLLIAVPLHVLNFAIVVFSPSIHALRLNFLEFFNKFYESGGEEYKPFHKSGGEKSA
jgi:V/A-type H+-transporting ATPase subunit I